MAEAPLHHPSRPTTSTGSGVCLCVQSPVTPPYQVFLAFFMNTGPAPCSALVPAPPLGPAQHLPGTVPVPVDHHLLSPLHPSSFQPTSSSAQLLWKP